MVSSESIYAKTWADAEPTITGGITIGARPVGEVAPAINSASVIQCSTLRLEKQGAAGKYYV